MGRAPRAKCQRCATSHPATTTETISFFGSTYEIDLCERQADALYRDLFGWARLGREVTKVVERAKRTEEERAKITFPMARRVEVLDEVPVEPKKSVRTVQSALPAKADSWVLTYHAQERCRERSITESQALWSAVDPTVDRPSIADDESLRLRKRGDIVTVVNIHEHIVLTVWDAATPKREQDNEMAYAVAHTSAA